MSHSESYIEKMVCQYAKAKGMVVYKFTGQKGVPDRIFMFKGFVFFIEFKAPKGKLRPLQRAHIKAIEEQGLEVYVIDDIDEGKRIINVWASP